MRRFSLINRARWVGLAATLTVGASLFAGVSGAQAVVIDMNALGQPSVTYSSSDQSGYYGVALAPGTSLPNTVPTVTTAAPCTDPVLQPDLILKNTGLCSHGGAVIHNNETYALTWDPLRRYWATTRNYVEQFLGDVATGSGTFTSPYSVTTQYTDGTGHAANASVFAGGCIDYGNPGGYSCKFGSSNPSGIGSNYPASGCPVSGTDLWGPTPNGPLDTGASNDVCLTDAQIQSELSAMVPPMGLPSGVKPSYSPLVVLLTPPGVEVCLDSAGTVCSFNSDSNPADPVHSQAQFCSYHGQVNVNGTEIPYVVAPWTAGWHQGDQGDLCDDPDVPLIPSPVPVDELATDVGARLVSPLSQGQLAAIVNPNLTGWFGLGGKEINDNGCGPLGQPGGTLDKSTVGNGSYALQREFNNAGAIEDDPNALPCIGWTNLSPTFVVPSAVNPGDVIQLDGSTTVSSLIVPKADYWWNFGDGTTAVGPSVTHSYSKGGTYTVKLTVTDRGGNTATTSQYVTVLGPNGQPVPVVVTPPATTNPATPPAPAFSVHLQLMPQSLKSVLSNGITVRVASNRPADGIAMVSVPHSAAVRAHLKAGRGNAPVEVGIGTVTIKNGTGTLHIHLSKATAAKLRRLGHVTLTIKLALVSTGGHRARLVEAGRY